ncbi:protein of unknown function [Pararobbsia alpina]
MACSVLLVRTIRLRARAIQRQRMFVQREAALGCNGLLTAFDFGVVEFFDAAAVHADQVVVVRAFVEFEHSLARLEITACEQARLLELRQYAIHRRKPDIELFMQQVPIDIFGGQMSHAAVLKNLENLEARQGRFQADIFQVGGIGHGSASLEYNTKPQS